jgi:hypothetical protein
MFDSLSCGSRMVMNLYQPEPRATGRDAREVFLRRGSGREVEDWY